MSTARRGGTDNVILISGGANNPGVYSGLADPTGGAGVPAAEGSVYLRYVGAAGEVWYKTGVAATAWTQSIPGVGLPTLDSAYDGPGGAGSGRSVTVDSGAVLLTNGAADATYALEIVRNPAAAGGSAISVDMNANANGYGFYMHALNAARLVSLHSHGDTNVLLIEHEPPVGAGADGIQYYIGGAGTAFYPFRVWESAAVIRTQPLLKLEREAAPTGHVLAIDNNATATSHSIDVDHAGTADGVYVSHVGVSTAAGVYVTRAPGSGVAACGVTVVMGANAGGAGVDIAHGGSGWGTSIYLSGSAAGQGGITVYETNYNRSAAMVSLARQANAQGHVVDIDNNATASSRSINVDHEGTAVGIYVDHSNANAAAAIEVLRDPAVAAASIGIAVTTGANVNGNGRGLAITNNGAAEAIRTTLAGASGQALVTTETAGSSLPMVELTRIAASTGHLMQLTNAGTTNSCSMYIDHNGDYYGIIEYYQGDWYAASIHLDGTGTLQGGVRIKDESNTAKTSQLLYLERSAASLGASLFIDHNGGAVGNYGVYMAYAGEGIAHYLILDGGTTTRGLHVEQGANNVYNNPLVKFVSVANATGGTLHVDCNSTGATAQTITYSGGNYGLHVYLEGVLAQAAAIGIAITETAVARTGSMLKLVRDATATGLCIEITPGGSTAAIAVHGGKIDTTSGADQHEYIVSDADHQINFYANQAERFRIDGNAGSGSAIQVYDFDDAALRAVSFGADDSGGVGFKLLRVPN